MKSLFNFYLDDDIKKAVNIKITSLCGIQQKGQLASLIRVLLKDFLECEDTERLMLLAGKTTEEYCLTTYCNKRSKL